MHPLHVAAEGGHLNLCKYIVEKTGDFNPICADKVTALHFAAAQGHLEVYQFIIHLSSLCTCLSPGSFKIHQKLTLGDCFDLHVAIMATLKFVYFEKATIWKQLFWRWYIMSKKSGSNFIAFS